MSRRSKIPREQLPELGTWDGPIHGELGVLATDGERAQCHVCGELYHLLAIHVSRTHGLHPDEYRAMFGLRLTEGLSGPTLREKRRRIYPAVLGPLKGHNRAFVESMTAEQRRANQQGRRWPLQARIEARGERVAVACCICGKPLSVVPSAMHDRQGKVCGQLCYNELHRRVATTRNPMRVPGVRERMSATLRRRLSQPEHRAAARAAARRRGRAAVAELAALPPSAFDVLPEADRAALALYYGLAGEERHTQQEIALRMGTTRRQVTRALVRSVHRLLGPTAPVPG